MRKVVILDGGRIPFQKVGTGYRNLMSYQLAGYTMRSLIQKVGMEPALIDRVILGNVISNIATSNVAREASILAGIPESTPCNTVVQACISSNRAIADAYLDILAGKSDIILAGGVDSCSDTPIGYSKSMRQKLFDLSQAKGISNMLRCLWKIQLRDFLPQKPAVAEYMTGRTMGQDCELLAASWNISREEQDAFAVQSHQTAAAAQESKWFEREVFPFSLPPDFNKISVDNIIRKETTIEKCKSLKPVFDKKYGTITAANASQLTDGAAAVIVMSEEKAKALNLIPKAEIVDFEFSAGDIHKELLLGPAYAVYKLLKRHQLTFSDIDVFEFHEAFAGQILANIKALTDASFIKQKFKDDPSLGIFPIDKLNIYGGSLAIGHPFGATGARLVTTAVNRLQQNQTKYALVAACAAGAHGHALLLKQYNQKT